MTFGPFPMVVSPPGSTCRTTNPYKRTAWRVNAKSALQVKNPTQCRKSEFDVSKWTARE